MNLIILAAGRGKRINNLTKKTPKPLISLKNGKKLLECLLDEAIQSKIFKKIIIVAGYKIDLINKFIEKYKKKFKHITVLLNPKFSNPSPITSILAAKNILKLDNFAIANADSFFEEGAFTKIKPVKNGFTLISYKKKDYNLDEMKVIFNKNNNIKFVGKNVSLNKTGAVSTGLFFVKSKKNINAFIKIITNPKAQKILYWHYLINELIKKGFVIKNKIINPFKWFELDNRKDLHKINYFLSNKE